ncbi:MAG: prolipoprotein diacylglyceryl transferase [Candidatus Algichlamydia australiensis]|nr:prolipoprotein diacylglyceryl transferase [Chlamydiales bacterium]
MGYVYWNPSGDLFTLPFWPVPIRWYGLFFALGFLLGFQVFTKDLEKKLGSKTRAKKYADRFILFVIIGVVLGARLGHILFYEPLGPYLHDPLRVLRIWEGGLASHGGVVAVLLMLALFLRKSRELSFRALLDLMVIPSCILAGFIRLGNFFNQEILGRVCDLPWAIYFGSPADGSSPALRHPAQLYEMAFYFSLGAILYFIKRKVEWPAGKLTGVLLTFLFSFRFLIEFIKVPQSALVNGGGLLMGQWLSLPIIGIGLYLWQKRKPVAQT